MRREINSEKLHDFFIILYIIQSGLILLVNTYFMIRICSHHYPPDLKDLNNH